VIRGNKKPPSGKHGEGESTEIFLPEGGGNISQGLGERTKGGYFVVLSPVGMAIAILKRGGRRRVEGRG